MSSQLALVMNSIKALSYLRNSYLFGHTISPFVGLIYVDYPEFLVRDLYLAGVDNLVRADKIYFVKVTNNFEVLD